MKIKYGRFESEIEKDIRHMWVLVERDGYAVTSSFIKYPHSLLFQDVTFHYFVENTESRNGNCEYSPTGFCNLYDSVRWTSLDIKLSGELAMLILIERINDGLEHEGFSRLNEDEEFEILISFTMGLETWKE